MEQKNSPRKQLKSQKENSKNKTLFKHDLDNYQSCMQQCRGQPGEYPTVLCGTIFYGGYNIVNDELTDDFDKDKADKFLNDMIEMSDVTGNPYIVQVSDKLKKLL